MDNIILKSGVEYITTEKDLENMHCATDLQGNELSGLRICRWLFNYVIDSKKLISNLRDKLHRRNMQIKELKKGIQFDCPNCKTKFLAQPNGYIQFINNR